MADLQKEWDEAIALTPEQEWEEATPIKTSATRLQEQTPEWAGKYPNLYGATGVAELGMELATEGAALTAGGIVGGVLTGGNPLGVAGGAGLAYGLTKKAERLGKGEKLPLAKEVKEAAKDVYMGTLMGPVAELPLKLAKGFVQKVTAPLAKKIEAETAEYIKTAGKMGYDPTAAEILGEHSKGLSMLEGILTYLPTSASLIYKARINNLNKLVELRNRLVQEGAPEKSIEMVGFRVKREAEKVFEKIANRQGAVRKEHLDALKNDFLNDLNAVHSPDARTQGLADALSTFRHSTNTIPQKSGAGKSVQDMLAQTKDAMFKSAGEKLEAAKVAMGETIVPLNAARQTADKLLAEELQSTVPDAAVVKWLRGYSSPKNEVADAWLANPAMQSPKNKEVFDAMMSDVSEIPKTWRGLDLDIQKLGKLSRDANTFQGTPFSQTRGSTTPSGRAYDMVAGAIKEDMEAVAKTTNPEVYKIFREGKQGWKDAKELFDDDVLGLMKASPEDVFKKVINPGEVEKVRKAKSILGEEGFQPFRELFSKEVVALDEKGLLDIAKTKVNINKYGETVQEVLGPGGKNRLLQMVSNAEKIERGYARTKILSDVIRTDSNGLLNTEATKKALITNKEKLTEHYTEAELGKFDTMLTGAGKVDLKHLARTKHDAVEFLSSLAGTDNTAVVNAIVRPNNTINIRYMQKLLGPERSKEVSIKFIENYLMKINEHGFYLPGKAAKVFNNYDATMKKMFDPQTYGELQSLMQLNRHAERLERLATNPSQTGQTLIMFQTGKEVLKSVSYLMLAGTGAGAAISGGSGAAAGALTTAGLLAVPYVLAKAYLSPLGRKYLTTGFKVPAMSPEGMKLTAKIAQLVGVKSKEQSKEASNE